MNNESVEIVELRKKIEESVGRVMHTPADFDFLSGAIWERIREYISPTTLKRTWGYLDGVKNIRFSTLETLARFAGFKSWDNYLAERRFAQEQNSTFVSEGVIEAARLQRFFFTVGYISAKNRELDMGNQVTGSKKMTFIQTDAAINGGNSGGPLLDINGNVVGINSAKISDTQVEGMCYAIPISSAIPIINDLMNRETLTYLCGGKGGITILSSI